MTRGAASYREWLPRPELRRHVACVWTERSRESGEQHRDRVLPDGFMDLIWGRRLWVRGADTRAHRISYPPGSTFVGIGFRPGAAVTVLETPASELVDGRVALSEFWGDAAEDLAERLGQARSLEAAAGLLEQAVWERAARASLPDVAVQAVVARVGRDAARLHVGKLAEELGLSERQLLRRCLRALGYGPKTLDRILRFQRFRVRAKSEPRLGLARLAALAGYADQPHLTRECRRLTAETPQAFLPR